MKIKIRGIPSLLSEKKKKTSTPPYREQGSTESQVQQKAAGMAYSCRKKRGPARKKCASKLSSKKGAAWNLYKGEITFKELRNLAKLGQKVKQHKSREPKHRKSLPKRATPAKN